MRVILRAKGAPLTTVGLALSLTFTGGAFEKFARARLGARLVTAFVASKQSRRNSNLMKMLSLG
jgi:hypothetical protein